MITNYIQVIKNLNHNINKVIDMSGYKLDFIQSELGCSRNTFYLKRKNATFTTEELEKIIKITRIEEIISTDENKQNYFKSLINI